MSGDKEDHSFTFDINKKLSPMELWRQRSWELKKSESKKLSELQNKKIINEKTCLESEYEQQRLSQAKVESDTEFEYVIDLTDEKENRGESVEELKMQLKINKMKLIKMELKFNQQKETMRLEHEITMNQLKRDKEELEEKVKRGLEGLEEDMMCTICVEVYIKPTALTCGHLYCEVCINEWMKKEKICPSCRVNIEKKPVRIHNMDSIIERNVRLMSNEAQAWHKRLIEERERAQTTESCKRRRVETTTTVHLAGETSSIAGPSHRIDNAEQTSFPTTVYVPPPTHAPLQANVPLADNRFQGWVPPFNVAPQQPNAPQMLWWPVAAPTHTATSGEDEDTTIDLTDSPE